MKIWQCLTIKSPSLVTNRWTCLLCSVWKCADLNLYIKRFLIWMSEVTRHSCFPRHFCSIRHLKYTVSKDIKHILIVPIKNPCFNLIHLSGFPSCDLSKKEIYILSVNAWLIQASFPIYCATLLLANILAYAACIFFTLRWVKSSTSLFYLQHTASSFHFLVLSLHWFTVHPILSAWPYIQCRGFNTSRSHCSSPKHSRKWTNTCSIILTESTVSMKTLWSIYALPDTL